MLQKEGMLKRADTRRRHPVLQRGTADLDAIGNCLHVFECKEQYVSDFKVTLLLEISSAMVQISGMLYRRPMPAVYDR